MKEGISSRRVTALGLNCSPDRAQRDERAVYMHEFSRRASKAFALRKQKGSPPVSYILVRNIAATTTMDRTTIGTIEPQHSLHASWCETQLWVFSGFCRVGFPLAGKASDVRFLHFTS